MLKASFAQMTKDYVDMTKKGLLGMKQLLEKGYAQEQVLGLLGGVPLKNWEKVIERQLAEDIEKDTEPHAAKVDLQRLSDARAINADTPYVPNDGSVLRENRKFAIAHLVPTSTTPVIISDKIIDNIDISKFSDPLIQPQVAAIITAVQAYPNGVPYNELHVIKTTINGLAPVTPEGQQQKLRALRILVQAEVEYEEIAQQREELFARPKRKELADLDNPHSVAGKYQDAVDLIRLEASEIFQQDFTTLTDPQLQAIMDTLAKPRETSEINPYTGSPVEAESTMTWVEELQKVVWIIQRNIDKGTLNANDTQKKIIKEFANEYFDRYKTKDDVKKLQRLLNQLLSNTMGANDRSWAENGAEGWMSIFMARSSLPTQIWLE